ncbi:MAG: YhdP family protein [Thermomonas sp.]|uniref:YhdP family protein n=1 Tax=Thermomonas sp. TaxID=1971895 RepID=UPI0039E6B3AE
MTMPWRHRLRLLRRGAWYALAAVLLLLAVASGIGSRLLPLAERNPQKIAAWLGERAGRPVAFDRVQTEWTRRGPLLRLDNLRVGEGADPLRIGDAEILVAQYAGLLPGRSFTELRLRGLDLALERSADGTWLVRGLPGQQQTDGGDPFAVLERLGELQVSHARLRVHAPELGLDLQLPRIDLRMQVNGSRIRTGARAWLRTEATPFEMSLDFDRSSGDGRAHAGSDSSDLSLLAGKLGISGVGAVSGKGRAQAWAQLRGHRVVALRAVADLNDVVLRGVPIAAGMSPPERALGRLELDARWAGDIRQWQANATRLRVGDGASRQVLDGLAVQGGEVFGMQAQRVDAAPLLAVLALSDGLNPGLRRWLAASAAGAVLQDFDLHGRRGGALQVQARIDGLQFAPVGNTPGMRGVQGWLQGDRDGLRLRFDPDAQVAFDWPVGFGVPHAFTLDGEAVAWRDGDGWTIHTPGLALGGDLQLKARGGIGLPNDGTRPRLDLAVEIGETPVSKAPGFWIHHLMPKATVQWLDRALQGGRLHETRALVVGDLDDWPFRNEPGMAGAGLFRAQTHIRDGVLKFQPDWPAAERLDAEVRFVADGFSVDGSARLADVPVSHLRGGIARFGRAQLQVDAEAGGDAANFLSMLRSSPLHKPYGDIMDNLRASGPAQAQFNMLLPLHANAGKQTIRGTVELAGAKLGEQRWKLAFDDVRGQARYDEGGFIADGLRVRHDGMPGQLSLRAGPHVRDRAHAFEAEMQAQADIDGLLEKTDGMDWLLPFVRGNSTWIAALAVPRGSDAPGRLRLQSNLAGTAIDLPEPLRKPAAQALPVAVDLQLPLGKGELEVTLGRLLSLRSRSLANGQTGVGIRFGGTRAEAPSTHGLSVLGQVAKLDALDWIAAIAGSREGEGLPLQRIDVTAERLQLLGSSFADARLQVVPASRGTAVQVDAPTLAGALLVPTQDGATVAGRFDRLHWALPGKTNAVAANAAATTPASPRAPGFDPARIPPLLIDVADLRIGSVALGQARFRSTPTAAGLRMDQITATGSQQRLSGSGLWSGRGDAARTQLALKIDSDDVGKLLTGLGLGGQVGGGKGGFDVDARWRGGPDAFALATLDAGVVVDVRNGQLLEIEPGAGRLLGLLGVAQLRRRLTLDFRDFFEKGFAFNRIHGNVRVGGGSASSDDMAINGPAADIRLHGSADLRAKRFDQTVDVLPKSGGILTAVGALAGGPVGAAVGAVANAVLDKPMQGIGAKTYRITGPWAAPKVEVIDRNAPSAQAKPQADPSG